MDVKTFDRETTWSNWMRLALAGDSRAYHRFLEGVTPHLRMLARREAGRYGKGAEVEDVVQEVLLAVHLKRGTWDPARPIGPWLAAIVRHKLIDSLRRKGHRIDVPVEDVMEVLAAEPEPDRLELDDALALVERLKEPQRGIVRAISLDGRSIRETARLMTMSEGAVRVALHRALKTLAEIYRSDMT
jgi:RNA polymerase sigma-70 factor (ECF subfamily)